MGEELTAERAAVLATRRELRKAKKAKGKAFKQEKQRARTEKKQEIVARIRAKRDEALAAKGIGRNGYGNGYGNGNGYSNGNGNANAECWLCGESGHQKTECPNRGAADLSKTCFQCRRRGHTSANCPQSQAGGAGGAGGGSNVCFNCGSDQHRLRDCTKPRVAGGASFATCFVCNQTGHLSSKCPQSTTGVYPRGGCCKVCKSIAHLARDCPSANISADGSTGIRANTKKTFGDEDEEEAAAPSKPVDNTGDALDDFELDDDESKSKGKRSHSGKHGGRSSKRGKY